MKLPRRNFPHLAAGAAALPTVSRIARAQAYPTRPVRVIVYAPAGDSLDIIARLMGQWLSERLGQPFIIENRPGAGGNIGTEAVVRAAADGYTLLLVGAPNVMNVTPYEKLNFVFLRDIAPVAGIIRGPNVMVLNPLLQPKTVPDFIDYAKANPRKVKMASSGNGSTPHVAGELFQMMTGVSMFHVAYRGAAPALTDLISGQVQVMFATLPSSIEHIRAGKLWPLAVTTATRSELLPDIPTVDEFVRGYEASNWFGLGAPKATPAEIVEKLNKEINASLADPKLRARLADLGGTPLVGSPADFGKLIAEETEKWAQVIRAECIDELLELAGADNSPRSRSDLVNALQWAQMFYNDEREDRSRRRASPKQIQQLEASIEKTRVLLRSIRKYWDWRRTGFVVQQVGRGVVAPAAQDLPLDPAISDQELIFPRCDGDGKVVEINIEPLLRATLLHAQRRRRGRGRPKDLGKEAVVFYAETFFHRHSPKKPSTDRKNPFHKFAERFYEVVAKTEPGGLDRQMRRVLALKRSGR